MTLLEQAEALCRELDAEVSLATSRIQHIKATRHALQARALADALREIHAAA